MKGYQLDTIIEYSNLSPPKKNLYANIYNVRDGSQRRIPSLEKSYFVSPHGQINKNKNMANNQVLKSDRTNFISDYQREIRSQSPLRVRDLLEKNVLNPSGFKPSKLKTPQKSNVPNHGSPTKKPPLSENASNKNSPQSLNHSRLNQEQFRVFEEKYSLKFTEGYSERIIEKCLELLQTEDNAIVLENILPGKYKDFVISSMKPGVGLVKTVHNNSYQLLKHSLPLSTKGSLLPPLLNTPQSTKSEKQTFDFTGNINSDRKESSFNSQPSKEEQSSLTSLQQNALPKISAQEFKDSLSLMTNHTQKTNLILISALNKSFPLEFGFCEIVVDEGKNSIGHISRYFVGKIYRKLRLVELLSVKVMDFLFKRYRIERISIEFLVNNDPIQKELQSVGFKLQKVDKVAFRYKTYLLSKKEFYQLFNELSQRYNNNGTQVHTQQ